MIPAHYVARLQLRGARARYVDARAFRLSDPEAYWAARAEYLTSIVAVQIALCVRPCVPQSPLARNRQA